MYVPIPVLVAIVFAMVGAAGMIILLLCGVTNRFVGFSLAFETIAQDYAQCRKEMKEREADFAKTLEVIQGMEKDLEESHKLNKQWMEDNSLMKEQKQYLTRQYIKLSNEYAWFRSLVREADPEKCARAEALVKLKDSGQRPEDLAGQRPAFQGGDNADQTV